jgi:hypothetical protein
MDVKHMQVPLYQSCNLGRGEVSIPLLTARSYWHVTSYTKIHYKDITLYSTSAGHIRIKYNENNFMVMIIAVKPDVQLAYINSTMHT